MQPQRERFGARASKRYIWESASEGWPCGLSCALSGVNFRFVLIWRLRNQKEVLALMEELSAIYPIKVLHQMYEAAIEEPHSFWHTNLVSKDKREMFYVRFDHKIVVD